jgi:uncharacterized protein with NAD-binding domain and iron-sulfur cluster
MAIDILDVRELPYCPICEKNVYFPTKNKDQHQCCQSCAEAANLILSLDWRARQRFDRYVDQIEKEEEDAEKEDY